MDNVDDVEEAKKILMMFAPDMSYSRADICLAMKVFEKAYQWSF